jgi:hypothetical protein
LLEYLHANSLQVKELKKKWLSVLLRHASCIVRECRPKGEEPGPWLFPVAAIKGSACIGWPAKAFHVGPGPNDFGYALDDGDAATEKLHWIVLLSLDHWEALEIVWRPPVWIQLKLNISMDQVPGILAMPLDVQPLPLHHIAARSGFWTINRFLLWKFAKLLGLEPTDEKDTFAVCWELVQHILGCSSEATLDIMKYRAAKMSPENVHCNEEFMKLDEAADILDQSSLQSFKQHKKKLLDQDEAHKTFVGSYQSKVRELRSAAVVKGKGSAKGKAAGGAHGHPWGARLYPAHRPPDAWSQPELKVLLPPGAVIWQGKQNGTWQGHLPPHRRISRAWHVYGGNRDAGTLVVRHLWLLYLADHALDKAACPVPGLMD